MNMENDLIRRSDLLAKKCIIRGRMDTGSPCPSKVVAIPVDVIERAPAVDAVEVVRCCSCKHFVFVGNTDKTYCRKPFGMLGVKETKQDAFCSYGERKGGSEDG